MFANAIRKQVQGRKLLFQLQVSGSLSFASRERPIHVHIKTIRITEQIERCGDDHSIDERKRRKQKNDVT